MSINKKLTDKKWRLCLVHCKAVHLLKCKKQKMKTNLVFSEFVILFFPKLAPDSSHDEILYLDWILWIIYTFTVNGKVQSLITIYGKYIALSSIEIHIKINKINL